MVMAVMGGKAPSFPQTTLPLPHPNPRLQLFNALLLVEENWGACSTQHESPSRLLRRFRRRAPPRKGARELPNHRTSLLFLTALQEFEARLPLCRPKRNIEVETKPIGGNGAGHQENSWY